MEINKKALAILSAGHLVTDLSQGALPTLLPFFKEAFVLTYTMSGVIILIFNLTSSVIQPFIGFISDRHPLGRWLPLPPLIACLGMSLAGWAPNYPLLLLCVMISGLGVSTFHPDGFKTASFFTGEKKVTGMSIFMVGGNLGFALGPILAIPFVTHFGLKGTFILIIPGVVLATLLSLSVTWLTAPVRAALIQRKEEAKHPLSRKTWISLLVLISVVIVRSSTQFGLLTYIPFYCIHVLKETPLYAGKLVSTFLLAGIVGTLIGGPLADAWGHKRFLTLTLLITSPLLFLFYRTSGILAFAVLAVTGMVLISTFTVTVVMAQTLLPHHLGMASALMVGFGVGAGGIGVTVLGAIADTWGVPTVMVTILVFPWAACGLTCFLPYPLKKGAGA